MMMRNYLVDGVEQTKIFVSRDLFERTNNLLQSTSVFRLCAFLSQAFKLSKFEAQKIKKRDQIVYNTKIPCCSLQGIDGDALIKSCLKYCTLETQKTGSKKTRSVCMSRALEGKVIKMVSEYNLSKGEIIRYALRAYANDSYLFNQNVDESGHKIIALRVDPAVDAYLDEESERKECSVSKICTSALTHLIAKIKRVRNAPPPRDPASFKVPVDVRRDPLKYARLIMQNNLSKH